MSLSTDPLINANHLFSIGHFDKAEESIRQILSEGSQESQHLSFLYKILFYAGKYKQLTQEAEYNDLSLTNNQESHYFLYKSYMAIQNYLAAIISIDNFQLLVPEEIVSYMDKAICHYQLSQLDQAEEMIKHIINLQPENAVAYNNLGNILKDKEEQEAAQSAYQKAIQLQPKMADAYVGLAIIARQKNEDKTCEEYFLSAINANPQHYLAHYHLATFYQTREQHGKAAQYWQTLTELYPYTEDNYLILSNLYQQQGERDKAIAVLEHCLNHNPQSANIQHLCASLKKETTESAPREYIQNLFNGYANSFDQHLSGELHYQTPKQLHSLWLSTDALGNQLGDILDLGCGTGLSGLPFRPYASSLTGVDLSEAMIAKAHEKAIYDKLVVNDITDFICQKKTQFNTCLAIDVINYTGNVSSLFRSINLTLKDNGLFLFSTERSQNKDYVLQTNGRYQHAPSYITTQLTESGFNVISSAVKTIRKEQNQWVKGDLYICQKV